MVVKTENKRERRSYRVASKVKKKKLDHIEH